LLLINTSYAFLLVMTMCAVEQAQCVKKPRVGPPSSWTEFIARSLICAVYLSAMSNCG